MTVTEKCVTNRFLLVFVVDKHLTFCHPALRGLSAGGPDAGYVHRSRLLDSRIEIITCFIFIAVLALRLAPCGLARLPGLRSDSVDTRHLREREDILEV